MIDVYYACTIMYALPTYPATTPQHHPHHQHPHHPHPPPPRGFTTSSSAADLASAAASVGSQSPIGGSWGGCNATTAGGLSLPPTRQEMPLLVPVMIRKYVFEGNPLQVYILLTCILSITSTYTQAARRATDRRVVYKRRSVHVVWAGAGQVLAETIVLL